MRQALHSLKVQLTLGVIAVMAIGIALIAVLLVDRAGRDIVAIERERELTEAVRAASLVSRRLVDHQRAMKMLAGGMHRASMSDDPALGRQLERAQLLMAQLSNVFVADPQGRIRMVLDEGGLRPSTVRILDRAYFQAALHTRQPVVSSPVAGRSTNEPVVVLALPVADEQGVFAVLGATLTLADGAVLGGLVSAPGPDDEGTLVVVTDAQGRVLAHPQNRMLLQSVTNEPWLREGAQRWEEMGRPVEPGGLVLPVRGGVVAAAGVAGTDWVVWRSRAREALFAPLREARLYAATWALGVIGMLSGVLLLVMRWRLRSLTLLQERAARLFDAGMDPRAGWPHDVLEIGQLSAVLRRVGVERAELEQVSNALLKQLESVMASAPVGIAFTRHAVVKLVSDEFCRLFRARPDQLLDRRAESLLAEEKDAVVLTDRQRTAQAENSSLGEWPLRRVDDSVFWASIRCRPVDPHDADKGAIWSVLDVDEQRRLREQLEWSARHDALTGAANRELFGQRIQRILAAPAELGPSALLMIDLDHFKPINDGAGHLAGDAVLRAVAVVLNEQTRASDLVARLGGDEFAVLLERCGPAEALEAAERIRAAIAAIALPWEDITLTLTASIGTAPLTSPWPTASEWVKAADMGCYRAKAAGGNAVRHAAT